ncbi:MAG: anti-sigma factor [Xanthomonadales bacterium]|nr:anti-sigma factor [Xanthomonadales bacterium]
MNTIDSQTTPPSGDMAAEYVLGVLDARERRSAETRIASDIGFSREVALWESRFMPLIGEIAPAQVPDYVWSRIRSALKLPEPGRAKVVTAPPGVWDSLAFWRWLATGAFAAAAAFAVVVFNTPQGIPPVPAMQMVATLADDNGVPGFVAMVDRDKARMTITPLVPPPTDGRAQELWLIPEGKAAISLGLLDATRAQTMRIPDELLADIRAGALFAVTLEPPEGAPHAKAAGPIIAKGGVALL